MYNKNVLFRTNMLIQQSHFKRKEKMIKTQDKSLRLKRIVSMHPKRHLKDIKKLNKE